MSDKKPAAIRADIRIPAPRGLYFLIFTVSGFSGLIYESIWSHYLKLFLGHAAYAQSLVLIIFMGGMALGSWLASRVSPRSRIPLLVYAAAEAVVGIIALLFHDVFTGMMDVFYSSILPSVGAPVVGAALKWLAASLLITPQSILLGMTFPLMSAGIIRRYPDTPGSSIAMLYFTNSIGAAIGVLASGFVMIGALGLPGTMMSAGLLNIALAIIIWILVRLDPNPRTAAIRTDASAARVTPLGTLFLAAAFITGAASFVYEIGWIRMLSLVLGATTHSFELMLSAFITGLAFGGLWIKRRIDRISDPVAFSGYVQLIMGALAVMTLPIYVMSFDWMAWLLDALNTNDAGFSAFNVASHVIALCVMLPATFMAGMTLPLFTYALIQSGDGEASIGRIYAANTLGAIVGVLFAVHVGLPLLGLRHLIVFGALLDIGLGLYLLAKADPVRRSTFRLTGSAFAGLGIIALTLTTVEFDKNVLTAGVYRVGQEYVSGKEHEVVYYQDGKTATVSLQRSASGALVLSTNGKPDAAIQVVPGQPIALDELTMTMAGSLPLAYMPDATRIANIGMGSGQTTHTLLASPRIDVVDTVEIEPAMVAASRGFGKSVERAHADSRSSIHVEDAKTFFSLHNNVYDIIIAEPSNPWVSGVASLFSTEFYRTIRNHLADDGLFVQWIQLYEFNDDLAISILKALTQNFPDYVVYTTDGSNILLIARKEGRLPEPDWSALFDSEYAAELARVHIHSHDDILIRKYLSREHLLPVLETTRIPTNSDYFPYVDLNAGRARFTKEEARMFQSWSIAPIPLLEMLHDELPVRFSNVEHFDQPPRLRYVELATWLHERLTNPVSASADSSTAGRYVSSSMELNVAWIATSITNCTRDRDSVRWQIAVNEVMRSTVPYLDPEQGRELVGAITAPACPQRATAREDEWPEMYRALADRDAARMLRYGRSLLETDDGMPAVVARYALAATMLGAIAGNEPDAAVAVWDAHARSVMGNATIPGHVRLLRSIATMARETSPALVRPPDDRSGAAK